MYSKEFEEYWNKLGEEKGLGGHSELIWPKDVTFRVTAREVKKAKGAGKTHFKMNSTQGMKLGFYEIIPRHIKEDNVTLRDWSHNIVINGIPIRRKL